MECSSFGASTVSRAVESWSWLVGITSNITPFVLGSSLPGSSRTESGISFLSNGLGLFQGRRFVSLFPVLGFDDVIDKAIFFGLFSIEEEVSVNIFFDFGDRLFSSFGENLV